MKANLMNKTIEMTKSEAKAAGRIDSTKYDELVKYQNAYPSFAIKVIATPKRKSQYSGLTYKYMEAYIQKCNRENKVAILNEFRTLSGFDNKNRSKYEKAKVANYREVKGWFLKQFPEIEEYKETQSKKIESILNAA